MPRKKFRAPNRWQLVRRWEQTIRVLKELSPHEKKNHFDMGTFAHKSDCGTIACAAGHSGLDPWFRKRGFKTVFPLDDRYSAHSTMGIASFFGATGTNNILMDLKSRNVSTVIKEIRAHIKWLNKNYDPKTEFPTHAHE